VADGVFQSAAASSDLGVVRLTQGEKRMLSSDQAPHRLPVRAIGATHLSTAVVGELRRGVVARCGNMARPAIDLDKT